MVLALIEAGFATNLLFSSDLSTAAQLKRNGGAGYRMTLTVWAPKLRDAGVDEKTLRGILVDNPRRFLAFVDRSTKQSNFDRGFPVRSEHRVPDYDRRLALRLA
jgi:hypothetical protein